MNKQKTMLGALRVMRHLQAPIRTIGRQLKNFRDPPQSAFHPALLSSDHAIADPAQRAQALQAAVAACEPSVNLYQSVFTQSAIEEWNPRNGARVVARAWQDPDYRTRLMRSGTAACAELGYSGPQGEYIVVLENTPSIHNVIVCTLCSCTAWPVLGLPPDWYKSFEYRSRIVRESRAVLHEMGFDPAPDTQIRVWDTTAETRYLVLPMRPSGTEGWTERELAAIVTREAMIGVAPVTLRSPASAGPAGQST